MKKLPFIILSILVLCGCGQFFSEHSTIKDETIGKLIGNGDFSQAKTLIRLKIASEDLTRKEEYDLLAKIDIMERTEKDFRLDDSTVLAQIKEYYPGVTAEELARWEECGALECKIIDGQKRYFHAAARNLFRISKEAQSKYEQIKGRQSDDLDTYLSSYIPKVVTAAKAMGGKNGSMVLPVKMKIRYTLKNDYMFKAVFQQNEDVLKGFLASLLNLPVSHIRNVHIENPMILGKNIYGKEIWLEYLSSLWL